LQPLASSAIRSPRQLRVLRALTRHWRPHTVMFRHFGQSNRSLFTCLVVTLTTRLVEVEVDHQFHFIKLLLRPLVVRQQHNTETIRARWQTLYSSPDPSMVRIQQQLQQTNILTFKSCLLRNIYYLCQRYPCIGVCLFVCLQDYATTTIQPIDLLLLFIRPNPFYVSLSS